MIPRWFISIISLSILAGLGSLSASADPATATTHPLSPAEEKQQEQAQALTESAHLPAVTIASPADFIRFSTSADMLVADLVSKDLPTEQHLILPNPAMIATLRTYNGINADPGVLHGFMMIIHDFSEPGSITTNTTISATGGRVQIARDFESDTVSGTVELTQDPPPLPGEPPSGEDPVRFNIHRMNQTTNQDEVNLKFSAPTFVQLRRDHPAETEQYLRPIFHQIGQEAAVFAPDPKAIWQVLSDDWKPDDAVAAKVKTAVAKFSSDSFQERQSAMESLNALGEPAALSLIHTDRSAFSAEQNSGIETFLAPYLPLPPEDARRYGQSVEFLLDCQYSDDVALRKLAAARLAKVLGKPVPFDPNADAETRAAQMAKARKMFSSPTTAP